jgi:hypothetical protein
MDSIAPEVAEEIAVFLENDDVDAGARQQEPEHHSGWTSAGDATPSSEVFRIHQVFPLEADYGDVEDVSNQQVELFMLLTCTG